MKPIDKKNKDWDAASATGGDQQPANEAQKMKQDNLQSDQKVPDREPSTENAADTAAKMAAGTASRADLRGTASDAENHNQASDETAETEIPRDDHIPDNGKEIERLREELARTRDSMLRKAAEFENLKRRTQKERLQLFEEARADAVSRFLPIREDLKRSVGASEGKELEKGFVDGLKLVVCNFERVLKDYGVEAIEETGVPFDVDKHDAMLIQPAPDESTESNTVLQVLEPGYKIGDRVIRHAKVIVSQ